MFSYNISSEASLKDFQKACKKIENRFVIIEKEGILEDVDGSLIQIYTTNKGKIKVFNDYEVDAVYIKSDVPISLMKVKYIGKNGSELSVLNGKIYECIGKEKTWYRVIDETDEDYLYPIEDFEVVEE